MTAPIQVRAGLTLPERLTLRELLVDWYAEHGIDEEHAMRQHRGPSCFTGAPLHEPCGSEGPGGVGCMCECHDAAAPTERAAPVPAAEEAEV